MLPQSVADPGFLERGAASGRRTRGGGWGEGCPLTEMGSGEGLCPFTEFF